MNRLTRHDGGVRLLHPGMQGIHVTAYSPLGSPDSAEMMKRQDKQSVMDNPTVKEVASKHNKAAAEVRMSAGHQSLRGLRLPKAACSGKFSTLGRMLNPTPPRAALQQHCNSSRV